MIVHKVADQYLEVEVLDVRAKTKIAELCEGVSLDRNCKVYVTFIRDGLDSEDLRNRLLEETTGEDEPLDFFECNDVDHD